MRIIATLIALLCSACTTTITVVDNTGKPVEDALVVSEQYPFILQSWKYAAFMTNQEGKAEIVSNRGNIFKESFYPIIDASELKSTLLWSAPSMFSSTVVLYPIKNPDNNFTNIRQYTVIQEGDKNKYKIPLNVCSKIDVTYDLSNSFITVTTDDKVLIPSKRYYFENGELNNATKVISGTNSISFYCNNDGGFQKVGLATASKVAYKGVWNHKLSIFEASNITLNTYIEPPIKCASEKNMRIASIDSVNKPKAITSNNLKLKIKKLKGKLPCNNKQIDKLLNYIGSL